MDKCKVAFIVCWKETVYLRECLKYLERIRVPLNCETDVITIGEADSIYAAYNAAMESSDADIKVYLREYVFIHSTKFIEDILQIFNDHPELKMLGTSKDAEKPEIKEASIVDEAMIITREDVKWREDLFTGYTYYAESECMEFRIKGFKIGAVSDPERWYLRAYYQEWSDSGRKKNAKVFSENYNMPSEAEISMASGLISRLRDIRNRELPQILYLLDKGDIKEGSRRLKEISKLREYDLLVSCLVSYVETKELEAKIEISSFSKCKNVDEIVKRVFEILFLGYEIISGTGREKFISEYDGGKLSLEAMALIFRNDPENSNKLKKSIRELFLERYKDEMLWLGICSLYMCENTEIVRLKEEYGNKAEIESRDRAHVHEVYFNRYYRNKIISNWFNGKCAVYTCITGGYDQLNEPEVVNPEWDYICFTDNNSMKSEHWIIVVIDNVEKLTELQLARKVKMEPSEYLKEYDYTIWVDGKMRITGPLQNIIIRYGRDSSMLCFSHPRRDTIAQEAAALIYNKKAEAGTLQKQIEKYKEDGYPDDIGLCDTACLVRSNHDPKLNTVMRDWFKEIMTESARDQMSLGYVCWKNNYQYDICDLSIYDNEFLSVRDHLRR